MFFDVEAESLLVPLPLNVPAMDDVTNFNTRRNDDS